MRHPHSFPVKSHALHQPDSKGRWWTLCGQRWNGGRTTAYAAEACWPLATCGRCGLAAEWPRRQQPKRRMQHFLINGAWWPLPRVPPCPPGPQERDVYYPDATEP